MVGDTKSLDPKYNLPKSEAPTMDRKIPMSAFDFDSQFEDGIISSAKIRKATIGQAQIGTISFSQLKGGTAILGGISDGDGKLVVNNAGGTEVVRLDNTGITITAGTISNVQVGTVNWTSGTIVNSLIGTSQITGGTVNPSSYKSGTYTGATGTILYLNTGTLPGTIVVQSGIIVSIS